MPKTTLPGKPSRKTRRNARRTAEAAAAAARQAADDATPDNARRARAALEASREAARAAGQEPPRLPRHLRRMPADVRLMHYLQCMSPEQHRQLFARFGYALAPFVHAADTEVFAWDAEKIGQWILFACRMHLVAWEEDLDEAQ